MIWKFKKIVDSVKNFSLSMIPSSTKGDGLGSGSKDQGKNRRKEEVIAESDRIFAPKENKMEFYFIAPMAAGPLRIHDISLNSAGIINDGFQSLEGIHVGEMYQGVFHLNKDKFFVPCKIIYIDERREVYGLQFKDKNSKFVFALLKEYQFDYLEEDLQEIAQSYMRGTPSARPHWFFAPQVELYFVEQDGKVEYFQMYLLDSIVEGGMEYKTKWFRRQKNLEDKPGASLYGQSSALAQDYESGPVEQNRLIGHIQSIENLNHTIKEQIIHCLSF